MPSRKKQSLNGPQFARHQRKKRRDLQELQKIASYRVVQLELATSVANPGSLGLSIELFQLDRTTGFGDFLFELFGIFLRNAFLDGRRNAFDQLLRIH